MEHQNSGTQPVRHQNSVATHQKSKKPKVLFVVVAIIVVTVLGLIAFGLHRASTSAFISGNKYQAVFFTNGQVYFGKLSSLNSGYMRLTDVYYLEAQNDGNSTNPQEANTDQNANVQLIKLGNEVHGPEDEMIISKDQILFFENLKPDGKVSDTINKSKQQN